MKVTSSGLETTGVPRGQNILQLQECAVQQVDVETHERPRISINVLLGENDPHPKLSKNPDAFVSKEKP